MKLNEFDTSDKEENENFEHHIHFSWNQIHLKLGSIFTHINKKLVYKMNNWVISLNKSLPFKIICQVIIVQNLKPDTL